jgi:FkbM family methyltransferase
VHFSLVVVGAHDGSVREGLIQQASISGKVLLIEPVPFLFARLKSRYANMPNVISRNLAVFSKDGEIEFTAPKETATQIFPQGDQLGSLVAGHAVRHDGQFAEHIETIRVQASTFTNLIKTEGISSIDLLFTDMEGMDANILPTFPFASIIPMRIIFEFKHADGTYRVGKKLAHLLILLEDLGYIISVMDAENMLAIHRTSGFTHP